MSEHQFPDSRLPRRLTLISLCLALLMPPSLAWLPRYSASICTRLRTSPIMGITEMSSFWSPPSRVLSPWGSAGSLAPSTLTCT